MDLFYLLVLIPLGMAVLTKYYFKHTVDWTEAGIQAGVGVVAVAVVFFAGAYSQMADTEIINGQITNKVRQHDTYLESYSCNCRSVRSGNTTTTHCDTCYRRHYTVDWYLKTTIGRIDISSRDWTSSAVYLLPDPSLYTEAQIGDPCAKESTYTNYVKGAPESIFHNVGIVDQRLKASVPAYPEVYDRYKVSHVMPVGFKHNQWTDRLNTRLSEHLKTLGAKKQVNINVIVTKNSQSFKYALEREWLGGKKNDVTVVIGTTGLPNVQWVDVFTYANTAGNNLVATNLRNQILDMKTVENPEQLADVIATEVSNTYVRKSMKDFEYLKDEIDPPTWVIVMTILFSVAVSGGLAYYFHHNDGPRYGYNSRSNYRRNF